MLLLVKVMTDGTPTPEVSKSAETAAMTRSIQRLTDSDYYNLPTSFNMEEEDLDGIALLRNMTEQEKAEVGGVLVKNREGKLRLKTAGKKGTDIFGLTMAEINESNLSWFTEGEFLTKRKDGKPTFDIVFIPTELAENDSQYFKGLVEIGTEVVFDANPVGVVHSHPSGNLPSVGDFTHVVVRNEVASSTNISEIVVTSEYTYFLFPTKQTPDLATELLEEGLREKWVVEEDETVRYLTEIDKTNGINNPDINSHVNAFRYNFLRRHCLEQNVGFYALKNGEKVAQRVF